ncbi:tropomyosin-2 [Mucor velutinosus]|uniref:Tropomyosin-2 n=1 Tax=Mucor velutinosus TaxID=708070 RepID=A0AAN7HTZ3_9FUNG|nr:tropomyosin-2 [Mucor velutinosus]
MKFILFIAFPLGTLGKEIRGLTELSGAKVIQLKDDLKREFERHYTQRDEHFNRLITERMLDLKQTVTILNQERIESNLKLELLENKVNQLVAKYDLITAENTSKDHQHKLGYVQLSEKYEKMEQGMKALEQKFDSKSTKVSSPINKAKSFELLSSKVSEIDSRVNLLKTKVAFIEQKLPSIQDGVQANCSHVQTRLTALEANYKSISPLKEQGVIKYLLEQAVQTENTLDIYSNDIKQLSNNLTTVVNKTEKEQEDQRISGEKLKKQVAALSESFKIANFAIGKLQTVTQEHYHTLLPIAKKVDTHEGHLTELSSIVNDIADYHLELVQSEETTADQTLEVEQETKAKKERHDTTTLAKPASQDNQHGKNK